MFQSKNSRNWSSTAREEPTARRINDVNPRNGSATSLANSQFSPLLSPVPPPRPALPYPPPPETTLSLSRRFRALPSSPVIPLEHPSPVFCSGPIPTRPEPQARPRPPDLCPLSLSLSCRRYVVRFVAPVIFTCLQHHSLYRSCLSFVSVTNLSLHTLLHRSSPFSRASRPRNSEIIDSRAAVPPRLGRTARKGFLHLFTHGVALLSPSLVHFNSSSTGRPPW